MPQLSITNTFLEEINGLDITLGSTLFRLFLSMVLGVLVGAERKRKGQIAGIRTFALISMGACLAMVLSIYVPQHYLGLKNGDPGRIAAQVITGIGFIGGGAMIQMKGSVRGLTTAAGIWMTAMIGMAVGVGMYLCAAGATLLCLLVLVAFEWYERYSNVGQESRAINLKLEGIVSDLSPFRKIFEEYNVHISTFFVEYDYVNSRTEISFVILTRTHSDLIPVLDRLGKAAPARSVTLSSQTDI